MRHKVHTEETASGWSVFINGQERYQFLTFTEARQIASQCRFYLNQLK